VKRFAPVVVIPAILVVLVGAIATEAAVPRSSTPKTPGAATPRWVAHVANYSGGISGGVRAVLAAQQEGDQQGAPTHAQGPTSNSGGNSDNGNPNVKMNNNSYPPMPQNETAVAYNVTDPQIAVAAANDYVSGGVTVMRTSDGGQKWLTTRVNGQFGGTRDFCTGGDPGVAYSRKESAFYISQLCFFRASSFSEVQVHKSVDNGQTWTPGRQASRAATNFTYPTKLGDVGSVDDSIFLDKELITVDNNPSSPHYGRIYVTYTKFHLLPNGFSDYCPIQLSYTDAIPTTNPLKAIWSHTAIQPDQPGGNGTGSSANQFSDPVVENNGTLDVGFVSENCNDSVDPHLLFQKSTDGGKTFLQTAVQIDKPGQYIDFMNADSDDTLPPTHFRAPNTTSLAYSPTTGTLLYVYQNNINRAISKADISYQTSKDGGLTWSDSKFLSTDSSGNPAANDQFMPWAAADESGRFYVIWFDRRLDPANVRINTWQAVSGNDASSFSSSKISDKDWNPNDGFFTSGAFIGDYNALAASTEAVYAVWTDGRDTAKAVTGFGNTDIFTAVQRHPGQGNP